MNKPTTELEAGSDPSPINGGGSLVRYRVLAFTVLLAAITYLDRVCISLTAPAMMRDLNLSQVEMSFVFSAFTLAYAAFEIPSGWWGDRIGTRKVLTRIVTWWSCFTILTSGAFNYLSLLTVRFLFGAGEAGAWPNAARTFSRWFPATERGTAQGIFFMGAHLGGGLTPLLVTAMLGLMHWRAVFVIFGATGLVWAIAWYRWFRDDPVQHKSVDPQELELITRGRVEDADHTLNRKTWRQLLTSRSMIGLCLMYFTQSYGFYFYITWLPTYLEKERGFTAASLGLFAGLPLLLSVLADLFGGVTTDRLTKRYGIRAGRCGVGGVSLMLAGLFLIAGTAVGHPLLSALFIAIAAASSNFLLGASWGTCIDIASGRAGLVGACMNTAGQIGGMLSPVVAALLFERFASWGAPLYVAGILYIFGACCWLLVDPRHRVFGE
jgi:MFS transporter, ACS family, glucarate transporter